MVYLWPPKVKLTFKNSAFNFNHTQVQIPGPHPRPMKSESTFLISIPSPSTSHPRWWFLMPDQSLETHYSKKIVLKLKHGQNHLEDLLNHDAGLHLQSFWFSRCVGGSLKFCIFWVPRWCWSLKRGASVGGVYKGHTLKTTALRRKKKWTEFHIVYVNVFKLHNILSIEKYRA